jgi:hypothetical protein
MTTYHYFKAHGKEVTTVISTNKEKLEEERQDLMEREEVEVTTIMQADGDLISTRSDFAPDIGFHEVK